MNSNSSLFLAILAMDAYNRTGGDVISRNLVVNSSSIGNVNVSDAMGVNSTGFFAQSYEDQATGQKIIAYRGTDFFTNSELLKDGIYGWSLGAGAYWASQAQEAAQFFQQVATNGNANPTLSDLYSANVVLTGHSLGGGLAGFIGSIYHQTNVSIFDAMDFTAGAQALFNAVQPIEHFDEFGNSLGFSPTDQAAFASFFRGSTPTSLSLAGIQNYSVQGQVISNASGRADFAGLSGPFNQPEYDLGFSGILSGNDRHSQSLLVIRMLGYGDSAYNSRGHRQCDRMERNLNAALP